MKQTLLIVFLGLGLFTLAACGRSDKEAPMSAAENKEVMEQEVKTDNSVVVDGNYQINTAESRLAWHGAKIVGNSHTGTAPLRSGSLQVRAGKLSGGEFIVDLATLKSDEGIEGLENHLKSADFFDVAAYPEAKLVITEVKDGDSAGLYQVMADLTIKGVTAPVSFLAKVQGEGEVLIATTEFKIDRTVWGLKYGSGKFFQDLGDKVISDDIEFNVSLKAQR